MDQGIAACFNSRRESNARDVFEDGLEGFDQRSENYLGWNMLVSNYDDGEAFRPWVRNKFMAISNGAYIAGVGMKKID